MWELESVNGAAKGKTQSSFSPQEVLTRRWEDLRKKVKRMKEELTGIHRENRRKVTTSKSNKHSKPFKSSRKTQKSLSSLSKRETGSPNTKRSLTPLSFTKETSSGCKKEPGNSTTPEKSKSKGSLITAHSTRSAKSLFHLCATQNHPNPKKEPKLHGPQAKKPKEGRWRTSLKGS